MAEMLGDAPIETPWLVKMNRLAKSLDQLFNGDKKGDEREVGFIVMVFPFGEQVEGGPHRCNYISNGADRKDVVILMKEQIKRFEGQPDVEGHA